MVSIRFLRLVLTIVPSQAFPAAMHTFISSERQKIQANDNEHFIENGSFFSSQFACAGWTGAFFQDFQRSENQEGDVENS